MPSPPILDRILYIDDEPMLQRLVGLSLKKTKGWTVSACLNGGQAVSAALERTPQLILLDMMLPDMDGTEVFSALRAVPELAVIPVAFLSGRCDQADRENYMRLGACGVIGKPINPMSLPGQIDAIWTGWHEENARM
ncbi:response regulator (plasmid) [Azospirillum argentinense]|uniref:Response regulator n=1 Tax=Azospirillum argentinense TaxID=2970906 RepID=A0A4D8PQV4_9PROT|nr:response regulator [Azospirillum argentinense]QCN97399.1 response regulator [Azospirillum argentinense]